MDVLFSLAHWHALAKLRQHTDLSLDILEKATVQLGKVLRDFQQNTCSAFNTQELKREMSARVRKAASKSSSKKPAPHSNTTVNIHSASTIADAPASSNSSNTEKVISNSHKTSSRLSKTLNLNTYKDHSLGDYVESIRQNGTVDSYSTEMVNYT